MSADPIRIGHADQAFEHSATCDCCTGIQLRTVASVHNRPGLSAIDFRFGDHARFKASMLAALASADHDALAGLGTRDDADLSIALIDAWASVCEVLSFYNERHLNEAYLDSATERLSVAELARLIGYRLHPGSAAETDLAFTMDVVPGTGPDADLPIPAGTKVQSQPGPDETPQIFETLDELNARVAWNAFSARTSRPVRLAAGATGTWLVGQATGLAVGDVVLAVGEQRSDPTAAGFSTASAQWAYRRLIGVEPSADLDRTFVRWDEPLGDVGEGRVRLYALRGSASLFGYNAPHPAVLSPTQRADFGYTNPLPVVTVTAAAESATRFAEESAAEIVAEAPRVAVPGAGGSDVLVGITEFGFASPSRIQGSSLDFGDWDYDLGNPIRLDAKYKSYVPGGWVVLTRPGGTAHLYRVTAVDDDGVAAYAISGKVTRLTLDTAADLATLESSYRRVGVFGESEELELAATPILDWVTGERVELSGHGNELPVERRLIAQGRRAQVVVIADDLTLQAVDGTTRLAIRGERLTMLAEPTPFAIPFVFPFFGPFVPPVLPGFGFGATIGAGIGGGSVDLPAILLEGAAPPAGPSGGSGSLVAPTGGEDGEQLLRSWRVLDADAVEMTFVSTGDHVAVVEADDTAETVAEVVVLADVASPDPEHDELAFVESLREVYDRRDFAVLGNVAPASHGESIVEILGAGDPSRPFQRFEIGQGPLTHLIAPTESGVVSTLEVRVDGVKWEELPDLYQREPTGQVFSTRLTDHGTTIVQFGDGHSGARPTAGSNNIVARARRDLGAPGNVRADQLALPLDQPLGLRSVTNPRPAVGGADPEQLADARRSAPIQTLTIGRLVSLTDYRDFALGYPGVAKADARWVWAGDQRRIVVTLAGDDGAQIESDSPVHEALLTAYGSLGDPFVQFDLVSYEPVEFNLAMRVAVDDAYLADEVLAAVDQAIRQDFGFEARDFADPVARSAIEASAHRVAGVVAVDIDALYRLTAPQSSAVRHDLLAAQPGRSLGTMVLGAELLMAASEPFATLEVM